MGIHVMLGAKLASGVVLCFCWQNGKIYFT